MDKIDKTSGNIVDIMHIDFETGVFVKPRIGVNWTIATILGECYVEAIYERPDFGYVWPCIGMKWHHPPRPCAHSTQNWVR